MQNNEFATILHSECPSLYTEAVDVIYFLPDIRRALESGAFTLTPWDAWEELYKEYSSLIASIEGGARPLWGKLLKRLQNPRTLHSQEKMEKCDLEEFVTFFPLVSFLYAKDAGTHLAYYLIKARITLPFEISEMLPEEHRIAVPSFDARSALLSRAVFLRASDKERYSSLSRDLLPHVRKSVFEGEVTEDLVEVVTTLLPILYRQNSSYSGKKIPLILYTFLQGIIKAGLRPTGLLDLKQYFVEGTGQHLIDACHILLGTLVSPFSSLDGQLASPYWLDAALTVGNFDLSDELLRSGDFARPSEICFAHLNEKLYKHLESFGFEWNISVVLQSWSKPLESIFYLAFDRAKYGFYWEQVSYWKRSPYVSITKLRFLLDKLARKESPLDEVIGISKYVRDLEFADYLDLCDELGVDMQSIADECDALDPRDVQKCKQMLLRRVKPWTSPYDYDRMRKGLLQAMFTSGLYSATNRFEMAINLMTTPESYPVILTDMPEFISKEKTGKSRLVEFIGTHDCSVDCTQEEKVVRQEIYSRLIELTDPSVYTDLVTAGLSVPASGYLDIYKRCKYPIRGYTLSIEKVSTEGDFHNRYPCEGTLGPASAVFALGEESPSIMWTLRWFLESGVDFQEPYLIYYAIDFAMRIIVDIPAPDALRALIFLLKNGAILGTKVGGQNPLDYFLSSVEKVGSCIEELVKEVKEVVEAMNKMGCYATA